MPAWSIKNQVSTPLLLMAVLEVLIAFSSIYVAGLISFGSIELCEESLGPLALRATIVAVVAIVSLIAMGLYQFHQRLSFGEAIVRIMAALVSSCLALAVIFYAFPSVMVPRELAGIAVGYAFILLLIVRYVFVRTVDENIFRRRTLIYGAGKRAASIFDLRRRADRRGFQIVGRVAAPGDKIVGDMDLIKIDGEAINDLAARLGADEIVVAMDNRRGNFPMRDLLDAKLNGIDVIDLVEFLERESGKIRVDLVYPGWLIFSHGFGKTRGRRVIKRIVDIVVSGTLSLLAGPLMLLIVLAIKHEDGARAPVLYRQRRVGQGGRPFAVLKFRSMVVDAESDGEVVWAAEDDSRNTRVGNILRKFRLDELPQLVNVLRGQMSIVGPRPERPEFVKNLQKKIHYYSERHTVKPGITGWAQINYSYGASDEDAIEKLQYDLYYIKNHTVMLDLLIILQTVEVVLWSKGAR